MPVGHWQEVVVAVVVEPQWACPSSRFVLASEHSNCALEGQQTPPIREGEEPQQAKPLLTRATTVQERLLFRPDGTARAVIASTAATLVRECCHHRDHASPN